MTDLVSLFHDVFDEPIKRAILYNHLKSYLMLLLFSEAMTKTSSTIARGLLKGDILGPAMDQQRHRRLMGSGVGPGAAALENSHPEAIITGRYLEREPRLDLGLIIDLWSQEICGSCLAAFYKG